MVALENTVDTSRKMTSIKDLEQKIYQDQPKELAQKILPFTQKIFEFVPLDEYENFPLSDLSGFVVSFWDFFQRYSGDGAKVRVFNPDIDYDGWLCPHTVIFVAHEDMPFIVDSIRIELNRRGINIHISKSTVFNVRCIEDGVKTFNVESEGCNREALMSFQVDLHSSDEELADITAVIHDVLSDVKTVVDDYQPMLGRIAKIIDSTERLVKPECGEEQRQEIVEFLKWIADGFYTFLGCGEYDLVESEEGLVLSEVYSRRQGIFKKYEKTVPDTALIDLSPGVQSFYDSDALISFTKSSRRSRVHRGVHSDYIVVKRFDDNGKVIGESRILGLYASPVYNLSASAIPLIRNKLTKVLERSAMSPISHDGKILRQLLEVHPRDELFQSSIDQLYDTMMGIWQINERRKIKLFMRQGAYEKFVNCIVYVPRDLYNTQVREGITRLLSEALDSKESEFTTYLSNSILARIQFIFHIHSKRYADVDVKQLERKIIQLTHNWVNEFHTTAIEHWGEDHGQRFSRRYSQGFSSSYQETFEPRTAVHDIELFKTLDEGQLAMSFYQPPTVARDVMCFKVFHRNSPLELSDMVPLLENLGFCVVGEHPYTIKVADGDAIYLSDYTLKFRLPVNVDVPAVRNSFQEAFCAAWTGETDNDLFNRLVIAARLDWRSVAMLRLYSRYAKQLSFNLSQDFIADTLANHPDTTRNLVALFKSYFDPRYDETAGRAVRLNIKIVAELNDVSNLNEDKVFRTYLNLINSTLRTNFFRTDESGNYREYISIKLHTKEIYDAPKPRPEFEIFVYSPRIEGVHLRGGKVARGGLRWSDRLEDYRTEVLGLVKAQQVKNAVIVPTGAKGGFVAKNLNSTMNREEFMAEGISSYRLFIRGLLDLTDNIVDGAVVRPKDVVCRDEIDTYLVVAADKGTATFSDIANEISAEYNHWLGDAFASGGSNGYDHKGMGITAKGAWVAVQRHFRERGINTQEDEFTVIGIGDMGGDVFGNGMLLSDKIRLQVAFNHLHIFIDPNPDAAASFVERQRLFDTPRSTWADFNADLISAGGGIFERSAKSISLSTEMRETFEIETEELAPAELIHELLKSKVDLIWNGGIGTYVKANTETHMQIGDRANDNLRVNGSELRCKVFGEGGNLGMSQLGRIEYSLNGGACNTDFIDNAAGVDCSDHEVNIKILLNELVASEDLTTKQRNVILEQMTDDVSELVLVNNYNQTQMISVSEFHCLMNLAEYRRFITTMEETGRLDRNLEYLPDDETLADRQAHGDGLVRPELSTLISYSKVELKEALLNSDVADDAYMAKSVEEVFPQQILDNYLSQIHQHSLYKEIISTQLANGLINKMGLTFYMRQMESTGASASEVLKAYAIVKDIFGFDQVWSDVESLDYKISSALQTELFNTYMRIGRRCTRWILRNWCSNLKPSKLIPQVKPLVCEAEELLPTILVGEHDDEWHNLYNDLIKQGLSHQASSLAASANSLYFMLGVAEVSISTNTPISFVLKLYHLLGHMLSLDWFGDQIVSLRPETRWKDFARESFMDELEGHRRNLTLSFLQAYGECEDLDDSMNRWRVANVQMVDRWLNIVQELRAATTQDFAMFSVALRELQDLSKSSSSMVDG